jgi:hypothetical protein
VRSDFGNELDLVGARGEALFCVLLTAEHPTRGFLFDMPRHLGDKTRSVDYFVEVLNPADEASFCLVQVKTTRRGYSSENRLNVAISRADWTRLASYPAPAYVVGIDALDRRGYIVGVSGTAGAGFSSMSTEYPLTPDVLSVLRDEVEAYGRSLKKALFRTRLRDPGLEER